MDQDTLVDQGVHGSAGNAELHLDLPAGQAGDLGTSHAGANLGDVYEDRAHTIDADPLADPGHLPARNQTDEDVYAALGAVAGDTQRACSPRHRTHGHRAVL